MAKIAIGSNEEILMKIEPVQKTHLQREIVLLTSSRVITKSEQSVDKSLGIKKGYTTMDTINVKDIVGISTLNNKFDFEYTKAIIIIVVAMVLIVLGVEITVKSQVPAFFYLAIFIAIIAIVVGVMYRKSKEFENVSELVFVGNGQKVFINTTVYDPVDISDLITNIIDMQNS